MERDNDTADDTTGDVSRRNVLKTTGTLGALAVGGALGSGSVAAAPNAEPETIEAPYEVVLGDGDVLANKRIVANGSQVSIVARGSGWEIRNVGIEGQAQQNPITVEASSGGSGLVENVYVGGVASSDETPIFVHREHAGTITIRNVNVGNTSNSHGIYASAPGSPSYRAPGGGGAVHIESCYAHDTGGNGFRIGSNGSYVRNSVAANCDNSGVWNQWQEGRVENVSIEAGVNAFNVGANNYDNRNGECVLRVSNVEYDAPNEVREAPGIGSWDFYVSSGVSKTSSPDLSPPGGVPTSAAEAAGSGSSTGESSDTTEESDDADSGSDDSIDSSESTDDTDASEEAEAESEDTGEETESEDSSVPDSAVPVEVNAASSNDGSIDYELAADGTFYRSNDDDSEDAATGSNASGTVWPGFTDTFYLDGELTNFEHEGEATVTVDGSTVDSGTSSDSDPDSDSSSDDESSDESDSEEASSEDGNDSSDSSAEDSASEDDTNSDEEDGSDASDTGDDGDTGAADEDRSLIVKGAGSTTNGPRDYQVTVTGTISDLEGNPDDTVSSDETTVDGKVWAPFFDRYAFSGEIASFETDGDVTVRVDGETVDLDSL